MSFSLSEGGKNFVWLIFPSSHLPPCTFTHKAKQSKAKKRGVLVLPKLMVSTNQALWCQSEKRKPVIHLFKTGCPVLSPWGACNSLLLQIPLQDPPKNEVLGACGMFYWTSFLFPLCLLFLVFTLFLCDCMII